MLTLDNIQEGFKNHFRCDAGDFYYAPGRVNLIGEHIDYNGGYVMPAAISRGMSAAVLFTNTDTIEIWAQNFEEDFIIDIRDNFNIHTFSGWKRYVIATLLALRDENISLNGAKIFIDSDLPIGAGLSSSAAFECLLVYIFGEIQFDDHRKNLALLAQKSEVAYVGVHCGIMDQYAVACGKKNYAMLLDCDKIKHEYVGADFQPYQLILMNTNKPRSLQDSKYNIRIEECKKALSIINSCNPEPVQHLAQAHEMSLSYIEDEILYARALHVVSEHLRVIAAVQALQVRNIEYLGELLLQSHHSLAYNYEVSGYELDTLVEAAMRSNRCIGSRMTGAGFGGCAIALVARDEFSAFERYVKKKYLEKTGIHADIFTVDIVDGVGRYR